MSQALYDYYNGLLGTNFERSRCINMHVIGVPSFQLLELEGLFSEDEVWNVIKDLPNEKAPDPDGFIGLFYKLTWETTKGDIMHAFNAFWSLDFRSLYHLNDAFMVLLKKKDHAQEIRDYRPISLIHSFGKLLTKCMANRLAKVLDHWCKATRVRSSRDGVYMTTFGMYNCRARSYTGGVLLVSCSKLMWQRRLTRLLGFSCLRCSSTWVSA